MTDTMRIEVPLTVKQRARELVTLDVLIRDFERIDHSLLDELIAGGDFLAAARRASEARDRVRRFLAERPGLRINRRLAPALMKIRDRTGYHVDEFSRWLGPGEPLALDWDELVYVDDDEDRFHVAGTV